MEKSIIHTYHIGGMSCGGCATTVKHKLSAVPGIESVIVDLRKRQAEITSSKELKPEALQEALRNTNYTISDIKVRSTETF
ncbi:heavy metal-associated domain-containing protein [soil metagenome]